VNTHLVCPAKVDSITWPEAEKFGSDAQLRQESSGRAETSGQNGETSGGGASVHLSTGRVLGARLVVRIHSALWEPALTLYSLKHN
jgi:hypothetical protein